MSSDIILERQTTAFSGKRASEQQVPAKHQFVSALDRDMMSPSAFSHLFRDVAGKSPYQFIKEMRLTKAREPLIENESSITSISKSVGYRSTSHFINEFRDRYGMTPRACSEALAGRSGGQDDDAVVDKRLAR